MVATSDSMLSQDLPSGERRSFGRADLLRLERIALNRGRWANADVWRLTHFGQEWVVKDFARRSWLVRWTIGVLLIWRELTALRHCAGLPGIPQGGMRIDRFALAYRFTPGSSLHGASRAAFPADYFPALEACVRALHERGLVHLDLRNRRNLLITPDGRPVVLDFQSHLRTGWIPRFARRFLRDIDFSGVYKHWQRLQVDTMGDERRAAYARMEAMRWYWFLRGYLGIRRRRKPDHTEP